MGTLRVPTAGFGEATLSSRDGGVHLEEVSVELRTLDSYHLPDLGFLKIDVEGHEENLLSGPTETISSHRPVIFIEAEERHNPGVVARIEEFLKQLGYEDNSVLVAGKFRPLSQFDLARDQLGIDSVSSPLYANNFLFRPRK